MVHDQQRVSQSGAPTFAQTILAIRELMKAKANAIIRIHVHPDRIESARALVEYLEREKILGHDGVKVYFWSTEDLHSQAIPRHEFARFASLFQDVARKQNSLPTAHFSFLEQIMDMESAESWPGRDRCSICGSGLHCVVDPAGDIYECIDDAGRKERRIGTLSAGKIECFKLGEAHVKPYLRDNPECLKCSVALYCGGGCTNRLKTRNASPSAPFCLQIKEFIGLTLRSGYLLREYRASQKSINEDGFEVGEDGKMTIGALIEAIQHQLTPNLLPPQFRECNRVNPLFGHCYHSVEALYHLIRDLQLPEEYLRFRLCRGMDASKIPHWWLQNDQGAILDPTAGQYTSKGLVPPYENGRLRSFLTKQPSKNARFLMGKIKQSVPCS
jgi:radical SAM protein with 4Fe4S-binding SPASM domain